MKYGSSFGLDGHETRIREPHKTRRKGWGIRIVDVQESRLRRVHFADDHGNQLVKVTAADLSNERWFAYTQEAPEVPGTIDGRYNTMTTTKNATAAPKKTATAAKPKGKATPKKASSRKPKASSKNAAPKTPTTHRRSPLGKVFGKFAYSSTSKALAAKGWTVAEVTHVLEHDFQIVPRHKGSITSTMRDKRIKPAEFTAAEWKKLNAGRKRAQAAIAKAEKAAA